MRVVNLLSFFNRKSSSSFEFQSALSAREMIIDQSKDIFCNHDQIFQWKYPVDQGLKNRFLLVTFCRRILGKPMFE